MRLTSVILRSSFNLEQIEFSVEEAKLPSRYIVRQIMGIDSEELIPKFYGSGVQSGSSFYDYTMRPRDIVMRVALNPRYSVNESVSEIRDKIYRLISATRTGTLQLQFKDAGDFMSVINGMITKMEVPYFTRLPELQITVHCPDPTFRSISPMFYHDTQLPTTNPLEIADNASTAPHGISFKVKFTATTSFFSIQDDPTTPEWAFVVTPTTAFAVDEELWFSSEYGSKLVYLNGPSPRHLMDRVEQDSIWPTIFPGDNKLYFPQIANFDWLELKYFSAYWGL